MDQFADGYLASHIKQNPRYFIRHDKGDTDTACLLDAICPFPTV